MTDTPRKDGPRTEADRTHRTEPRTVEGGVLDNVTGHRWTDRIVAIEIEAAAEMKSHLEAQAAEPRPTGDAALKDGPRIEALRDVLHERYGELLAVCDGFHSQHGDDWEGYWAKEAAAIIEAVGWAEAAAGPRDDGLLREAATLLSLIDTANVPGAATITLSRTGTLLVAIEQLRVALAATTGAVPSESEERP